MRKKFNVFLTLLLALVVQITFAQEKSITGVVTEAATGDPMPGVNVIVKGTQKGAATDFDGKYTIKANEGDILVFSYTGYKDVTKKVGSSNRINVIMKEGGTLGTVIIHGAKGIIMKPKQVTYSQQVVKAKDLKIGGDNNVKTALTGKVAGITIAGQAGTKLGRPGQIFVRGGAGLVGKEEAMYIVDGIEMNLENVDMNNIESINVLKGPAAVALYGLRGRAGVILVTTKKGKKGKISVDVYNTTTFENVAYLPNYQNEYGQGYHEYIMTGYGLSEYPLAELDYNNPAYGIPYPTEWQVLDGARYNQFSRGDESWGPKFDGEDYAPWYVWWPGENNDNPYYGKLQKYEAHPDNIKNFYDTGLSSKTGFAISGGTDKAIARLTYGRLDQKGIMPFTNLSKDNISANFIFDVTKKFRINTNVKYSHQKIHGNFSNSSDSYGNATSGSFNQWFGRELETDKLRELRNLKNVDGYHANWNWFGPVRYTLSEAAGHGKNWKKNNYWYNPYWQLEQEQYDRTANRLASAVDLSYKFSDSFTLSGRASLYNYDSSYDRKTPYSMQYNANGSGITFRNSFAISNSKSSTVEFRLMGNYNLNINKALKFGTNFGAESRSYDGHSLSASMTRESTNTQYTGLGTPDVYNFKNSKQKIKPTEGIVQFETRTLFSRFKLSYNDYLFLNADISNVWDSRYDIAGEDNVNSFLFGSAGVSFIFTEALKLKSDILKFGKFRASYGEVGSEVGAQRINPQYGYYYVDYNGGSLIAPPSTARGKVVPSTSTEFEVGTDLKFFKNNRLNLSVTYFTGHRKNEIINTSVAQTSGLSSIMVNAGDMKRDGFDIELSGRPIKTNNFKWDAMLNISTVHQKILSLNEGSDTQYLGGSSFSVVSLLNMKGEEYGQLVGTKIKRDDKGNAIINADGTYATERNQKFGSIMPDFNGGLVNRFSYKGFTLAGTLSFQKGGKFFSLTEWWGNYSGILAETAGKNDKGNPKRDLVADGGGVRVTGVDASGNPVDTYVETVDFYQQQYSPRLAEGYVHDASYIKFADLSLSYKFNKKILGKYIKGATVGVVVRNLGMIAVSSENKHNLDPSEFGRQWGEDAQLPGTRSYGFNVKLQF